VILEKPIIRVTSESLELANIPKGFWKFSATPYKNKDTAVKPLDPVVFRSFLCSNRGILVTGPFCTGKTAYACILARIALSFGASMRFIRAFELYEKWPDMRKTFISCDMLLLDDLGAEEFNNKTAGVLEYLVRNRYESDKFTVVTTNLTPTCLKDRYRGAFVSVLFRALSHVVILDDSFQRGVTE